MYMASFSIVFISNLYSLVLLPIISLSVVLGLGWCFGHLLMIKRNMLTGLSILIANFINIQRLSRSVLRIDSVESGGFGGHHWRGSFRNALDAS